MHRTLSLLTLLLFFLPAAPAAASSGFTRLAAPAADIASYTIQVQLTPDQHRLEGQETIAYHNATGQPIPDLVFHLYLNAFKSADTIFMRESGGRSRGYSFSPENNGWIEVQKIHLADGAPLKLEPLEDGTLARAVLPRPIAPGETLQLGLSFTAQLPQVFARTGWALDASGDPFFMVGQWFPKLGVWTEKGWNAYPFHASSEFFADFGAYAIQIRLPRGYQTAATGLPTASVDNGDGTQTVSYQAKNVIDFAWTASPNLKDASRQVNGIDIHYVYLPEHAWSKTRVLDAAQKAVTDFGRWYGPYPYPRLAVVDVPDSGQGAGGMEYPSLVTAGMMEFLGLGSGPVEAGLERALEVVTIHEIGHQWWQSVVAFNEAEEPWLDEGITDYSTARLMNIEYGETTSMVDVGDLEAGYLDLRRGEYVADPGVPMFGKAWDFSGNTYEIGAYAKPAVALLTLERVLGEETMLKIFSTFFQRYRFAHPTTEDLHKVAAEVAGPGQDLSWFFDDPVLKHGLVYGSGYLNYTARSIGEKSITAARDGDLAIPTEIEVSFADGGKQTIAWDGKESPRTINFDRPVRSFTIDPGHKLVVDLVWSDNGLARQADLPAWLSVITRLIYHLQDWLLILGGI